MNAFVSGQQNELASPFSTKIDLQVSTIERSRESFADEVLRPALEVEPGIDRLSAMLQAGFSYAERNSFLKDFFFATTPAVLDDYPEPVRDHIRQLIFSWQNNLQVVDMFSLSAGVYIFNLRSDKKVENLRIIKL